MRSAHPLLALVLTTTAGLTTACSTTTSSGGYSSTYSNSGSSSPSAQPKRSGLDKRLVELSWPHVACSRARMSISDKQGNQQAMTYTVDCDNDAQWRCSSTGRSFDEPETVCSQTRDATAPPASKAAQELSTRWLPIAFDICPLAGRLPGEPKGTPIEGLPETEGGMVSSTWSTGTMVLTCANVVPEGSDHQKVLEGAVRGVLNRTGGKVEKNSPMKDQEGRTVLIALPDNAGTLILRLYIHQTYLINALAAPRENIATKDLKRFFGGVRLLDEIPEAPEG